MAQLIYSNHKDKLNPNKTAYLQKKHLKNRRSNQVLIVSLALNCALIIYCIMNIWGGA